jgi:hypothetical protein
MFTRYIDALIAAAAMVALLSIALAALIVISSP